MISRVRALHFVFKVADRAATSKFYQDVLGMKVLRHEEFTEGCAAQCNGPYANRWSKTMVGYGPEKNHFVIELTYNYGVQKYRKGNDFIAITIKSRETIARAKALNWPITIKDNYHVVEAPGGYAFHIIDEPEPTNADPVEDVILGSSDIEKTIRYWHNLLNMEIYESDLKSATLGYKCNDKFKLKFIREAQIDKGEAYGRIAFAVPYDDLPEIQRKMESSKQTILTPLITLDTPGKASVTVVILADPDGHEICFVDEENFSQLSEFDPKAKASLDRYITKYAEHLAEEKIRCSPSS